MNTKNTELAITKDNAAKYATLTSVGGALCVQAEGFSAPSLTSVGSYLCVYAEGFSAPSLTSVGGALCVYAEGFSAPSLTSVGGALCVYAEGFSAPALTSVGYLCVYGEGFSAPALTSIAGLQMPDPAIAHERLIAVARQVLAHPDSLDMSAWHSCDTTHSVGGWAIQQAGEEGRKIEKEKGSLTAATYLLGLEGARLFFLGPEKALAKLKELHSRVSG